MKKKFSSLKNKMMLMVFLAVLPFLVTIAYLVRSLVDYSNVYDNIVTNITMANDYNMDFKEEVDESLYRMVARDLSVSDLKDEDIRSPYETIADLRIVCAKLSSITSDDESKNCLSRINHDVDTLENRVNDICVNIAAGGKYDHNIVMLENNIYILTELIQDDIQNYIYYQTKSIEHVKQELNARVASFVYIMHFVTALIVLAIILVTNMWSNSIISPVKKLVTVTGKIAKGDFETKADISSGDEIAALSHSVNDMSTHLQELVDKIKDDERRMRHTELRLLQEQINPHFLYNTLDTIVWLIESDKAEQAEKMVMSLSSFFRLSLSQGRERIKISDEIKHITSYLEIQQIRYKDILDYQIDVDREIYPSNIMKLTLQPLVENALYHGIKYKRAKGIIRIEGRAEGKNIVLKVIDDGVGIEEDKLRELNEQIQLPCAETKQGFGLANVNERIRMNFGPEYGINIQSEKGQGTVVSVTIPMDMGDICVD